MKNNLQRQNDLVVQSQGRAEAINLFNWESPVAKNISPKQPDSSGINSGVILQKRIMDFTGAFIGLLILSPVILLVALAVKLTSKGPIFFRQKRVGQNGDIFDLIKFRSMRTDAETISGAVWADEGKGKKDPRVTPIGDFLRKSHLDEIPQLFLVLTGKMSLVGPRPERPEFVAKLKREFIFYDERIEQLKPGVTGIAQMKREKELYSDQANEVEQNNFKASEFFTARNLKETNDKLLADHAYGIILSKANNINYIFMDLKIMILTLVNIFFR